MPRHTSPGRAAPRRTARATMSADDALYAAIERDLNGRTRFTLGDLLLAAPTLDQSAERLRARLIVALERAGGHLEVAERDVIYVVPARLRRAIAMRDVGERARRARARTWRALARGTRIAFGAFLVVSVTIVAAAVIAMVVIALSRGHQRGSGGGGGVAPVLPTYGRSGGLDADFWFYLYMRDLLHLSLYHDAVRAERMRAAREFGIREVVAEGVPVKGGGASTSGRGSNTNDDAGDPNRATPPAHRATPRAMRAPPGDDGEDSEDEDDWLDMKRELSFMESIYAFVFGRGDPNESLDVRRWRAIGALLRVNQGAVFAEQVAPFLDSYLLPKEDYAEVQHGLFGAFFSVFAHIKRALSKKRDAEADASAMHEGYMLEVMTRFNGYASASDDGKLVYVFPALQVTTIEPSTSSARRATPMPSCVPSPSPPPIYERVKLLWERGDKMPLVVALGILNVFLIWVFRAAGGMDFTPPRQPLDKRQVQTMGRRAGRFRDVEQPGGAEYAEPPLVILFLELFPKLCKAIMPLLMVYACIFFALPCARACLTVIENSRIRRRNGIRRARVASILQIALNETDKQRAAHSKQALEVVV